MPVPARAVLPRALSCACLALLTITAFAHHPLDAKFDTQNSNSISGRVSAVDWSNPHVHVFINVTDADGAVTNWALELPSRIELEWSGWRPDALAPGDMVSATGWLASNGTHQLWADRLEDDAGDAVFAVRDDVFAQRLDDLPGGEIPRWPDGLPRLGPVPGETGHWTVPGYGTLVEDGQEVAFVDHGILVNADDASKVAPFQPWALDLYRLRQNNDLRDDPLFLYCTPPGGPRQFQSPFGVQFVEEKARERLFVLHGGGNGNWRIIYTDARDSVSQVSGNDDNPLFYGRSTAHWEGDTLVVTTTGFNEGFWFSNGGLPHTRHLNLTERFTRTGATTLHYAVTVDDAGAYTRPWTSSWDLRWLADEELPEYYCQDNRP